jgi:glycyl-tRNA synthetase beta subunit
MLGLLDKKKNIGALIVAAQRKEPTVKVTKMEKEPGAVVEKEEEVGLKDQMEVCASRILRAIKEDDKALLVKAMFQLHECIDQAIEEGMDLDEDEGEGESGEMLEDEGVEY